jgi:hypothetical protein
MDMIGAFPALMMARLRRSDCRREMGDHALGPCGIFVQASCRRTGLPDWGRSECPIQDISVAPAEKTAYPAT